MTVQDPALLAADLQAGRVDEAAARKLAAKIPAEVHTGQLVSALATESLNDYAAGRTNKARAAATIVDAATKTWTERLSGLLRGGRNDSVLDLRARALTVLRFIEADEGKEDSSDEMRRASEKVLASMGKSARTRLAIAVAASERALRQGRAEEAVSIMEKTLKNPELDDSQRAAAQAVLAGSLRLAGREAEGIATLEATAQSFAGAGRTSAVIDADLERAIHLIQAGDNVAARTLLVNVADAAAAAGNNAAEVEARLRLGKLAADAGEHPEGAQQFQLAAAAARRADDDAGLVIALRNAADELRRQHDLAGAERLLNEALAINATTPTLEIDLATAKCIFAVVRSGQGRHEEGLRLLSEAESTFRRKLDELGPGETPLLREHLESQLRQVASLREKFSD